MLYGRDIQIQIVIKSYLSYLFVLAYTELQLSTVTIIATWMESFYSVFVVYTYSIISYKY